MSSLLLAVTVVLIVIAPAAAAVRRPSEGRPREVRAAPSASAAATLLGRRLRADGATRRRIRARARRSSTSTSGRSTFPRRSSTSSRGAPGIAVHYDLYDSNEAGAREAASRASPTTTSSCRRTTWSASSIQLKLLRPLDSARMKHLGNLDPRFLDKEFDPKNAYSLPYVWGTTGYGYDKHEGGADGGQLGAALRPEEPGPDPDARRHARVLRRGAQVPRPLAQQHGPGGPQAGGGPPRRSRSRSSRRTTAATTRTSSPPATSGSRTATTDSSRRWRRPTRSGSAYVLPKEGATLWMDSVCIPARARNVESIYAFLDYILEPEVDARIVERHQLRQRERAGAQVHPTRDPERPGDLSERRGAGQCELLEDIGDAHHDPRRDQAGRARSTPRRSGRG